MECLLPSGTLSTVEDLMTCWSSSMVELLHGRCSWAKWSSNCSLGGEVVGTDSGNSGLVDGDHGAIREGLEAMGSNLGTARSRGNTGRKNLGMDCLWNVLDVNIVGIECFLPKTSWLTVYLRALEIKLMKDCFRFALLYPALWHDTLIMTWTGTQT